MKKSIILLFFLAFSINVNAQKKKTKAKPKPKVEEVTEAEGTMVALSDSYFTDNETSERSIIIDTLHIYSGKKYVFLVDVNMDDIGVQTVGGEQDTEEKELQNNFPELNLEIIKLNNYTYVVFENDKTLEVDGIGNSYKAMAYWSGNIEDTIEVQESIKMATEFVSAQVGENKESSYVVMTRKAREQIEKYKNSNNFTEKSKQVMKAILGDAASPMEELQEKMFLFPQNQIYPKTYTSYISENNKKKYKYKSVEFNSDGNPKTIIMYSDNGKSEYKNTFVYENDKLISIEGEESFTIQYDDEAMILLKNKGDAEQINIYKLKDNVLLETSYILMEDDSYSNMNYIIENILEDNCKIRKYNNTVYSKTCRSKANGVPFIKTATSYQDGEVMLFRKSKIVKKDDKTLEEYFSTAESENEKDHFELGIIYKFNEKNLLNEIKVLIQGKNNVFTMEYTY
jgi:hypothetical protein